MAGTPVATRPWLLGLSAALAVAGAGLFLAEGEKRDRPSPRAVRTSAAAASGGTVPRSAGTPSGRALFAGKGCSACHALGDVPGGVAVGVGPDLTTYRGDTAFLRRWLADPAAVRPGTTMPDLDLTPAEIRSLASFLSATRR